MSRAYIEELIGNDTTLAGLGITPEYVIPQQDLREIPRKDGLFIVIRWEESTIFSQNYTGMSNGLSRAPRLLSIWVHSPICWSTDFERIDRVLDRIDSLFSEIEQADGDDGYTITTIGNASRSGDLEDEYLMTVTRNAAYRVLYRRT